MDDPHDPPCVRCRRESKECYFSATRRKRKADGEGSDTGDQDHIIDDYAKRNGRKSVKTDGSVNNPPSGTQHGRRSITSSSFSATSPSNGYSLTGDGSFQEPAQYATGGAIGNSEDGQEQEVANDTAAALFQSPINIPGDALHLLLKASGQSEDLQRRDLESQSKRSTGQSIAGPSSVQGGYRSTQAAAPQNSRAQKSEVNIDPAIAADRSENGRSSIPKETLEIWSRLRFVRAGWFTAREGISYLN